jgi:tRNA 2-thiouridine synthesizing protein A
MTPKGVPNKMKTQIDAKRLLCPMPVIRLGEMIAKVAVGDTIEMLATDPGVLHDIPAWCNVHGHKVLEIQEKDSEFILLVEKIG